MEIVTGKESTTSEVTDEVDPVSSEAGWADPVEQPTSDAAAATAMAARMVVRVVTAGGPSRSM